MGWAVRSRPQLHRRFGSRRTPVRPGSGRGRCVRGVGGRARGVLGATRSLSPDPGRLPEARAGQLPPPVSEVVMEGVMKVCLRAPAWAAVLCLATRVATAQVISWPRGDRRSEEHTSELQSLAYLVCRLLLEKKKKTLATATSAQLTHSDS